MGGGSPKWSRPPPPNSASSRQMSAPGMSTPNACSVAHRHAASRSKPGGWPRWSRPSTPCVGAVHRRHDDRGRTRRPDARCEAPARDERSGPAPLSICQRCAAPPGVDHQRWPHPCPPRPGRRGLGVSRSGERQSSPAPAARHATARHPRHQLDSPRQAVSTRSTRKRTGQTREPGGCGHGPGTRGLSVGPGHTGPRDPLRPLDRGPFTPSVSRCAPVPRKSRRPGVVQPATA
jgi:hypothetical protein